MLNDTLLEFTGLLHRTFPDLISLGKDDYVTLSEHAKQGPQKRAPRASYAYRMLEHVEKQVRGRPNHFRHTRRLLILPREPVRHRDQLPRPLVTHATLHVQGSHGLPPVSSGRLTNAHLPWFKALPVY